MGSGQTAERGSETFKYAEGLCVVELWSAPLCTQTHVAVFRSRGPVNPRSPSAGTVLTTSSLQMNCSFVGLVWSGGRREAYSGHVLHLQVLLIVTAPLTESQECAAENTEPWSHQSGSGMSPVSSQRVSCFIAWTQHPFHNQDKSKCLATQRAAGRVYGLTKGLTRSQNQ